MGRRSRNRVKGFRPGKEPPHLRKQAARQQFADLSPAQERMVELFSDRSPQESRAMLAQWRRLSLGAAIALLLLAIAAWWWTPIAGVVVGLAAVAAGFIHLRLRLQRAALESMADAVAGVRGGRRKR